MTIHNTEFEWISAAHAGNLSYAQFKRLPIEDKEQIIGHYRAKLRLEAVQAFATRPRKRPKPPGSKRGRRRR